MWSMWFKSARECVCATRRRNTYHNLTLLYLQQWEDDAVWAKILRLFKRELQQAYGDAAGEWIKNLPLI